jgi:hypothetical protein
MHEGGSLHPLPPCAEKRKRKNEKADRIDEIAMMMMTKIPMLK